MSLPNAAHVRRRLILQKRRRISRSTWVRRNGMGVASIIAGIVVGLWIPFQISINESAEAHVQRCLEQVLALRESATALQRGYLVDRADKPNRLADWDDTLSTLDLTRASCEADAIYWRDFLNRPDLHGTTFVAVDAAFRDAKQQSSSGQWSAATQSTVESLSGWTSWAVGALPR